MRSYCGSTVRPRISASSPTLIDRRERTDKSESTLNCTIETPPPFEGGGGAKRGGGRGRNARIWVGGGESIESDTEPKPDAKATLSSSPPLSACCLEGPDDFSRPFPPYPVTSVHSTSPEHAPSDDVDVEDNDADIRALVIWDVKRL